MDFGVGGSKALMSSSSDSPPMAPGSGTMEMGSGSGLVRERSSGLVENDWRNLKMARTDYLATVHSMLFQTKDPLFRSNYLLSDEQQQQQPSLSTPQIGASLPSNDGLDRNHQNPVLPNYYHSQTPDARNAGQGSGSLNENMHDCGVVPTTPGPGGPFTPSQWMEYEYQSLILKHLKRDVGLPPNLLLYIEKNFTPSGFSKSTQSLLPKQNSTPSLLSGFTPSGVPDFSAGSSRSNSSGSGLGSLHLCFTGSIDQEPGRCRRTDGKKWRCSRDVVSEQRYCERHLNKSRCRSRKHVEHAESGSAVFVMTTAPSLATLVSGGDSSNCVAMELAADSSAMHTSSIILPMPSGGIPNAIDGFPIAKQEDPFEGSSLAEFGLMSSDSSLNPLRHNYVEFGNVHSPLYLNDQEFKDSELLLLHHFINEWQENKSDQLGIIWPEAEVQSERTQRSISIPVSSSDFSSSKMPLTEELSFSSFQSSTQLAPFHTGPGLLDKSMQKEDNSDGSSEASMRGPPEQTWNIKITNDDPKDTKNSPSADDPKDTKNSPSAINFMTEGGGDANPQLGSSPTDILLKTTFKSSSNSSAGSSPRAENNNIIDHTGSFDDLLESILAYYHSIP